MTKKKSTTENKVMSQIFLVSMVASLLTGVFLITFMFLMMTSQPEQLTTVYGAGIFVVLFISVIAAYQYKHIDR